MSDHASHETTAADAPLFSPAEVEQFAADDDMAGGAIGKMLSALFLYTIVAMSIAGWWTWSSIIADQAASGNQKAAEHGESH
jgi:hypothetical protein